MPVTTTNDSREVVLDNPLYFTPEFIEHVREDFNGYLSQEDAGPVFRMSHATLVRSSIQPFSSTHAVLS